MSDRYLTFQAKDLAIDESSFTGENHPSTKSASTIPKDAMMNSNITQRTNIAFMGTLVRCGRGQVYAYNDLLSLFPSIAKAIYRHLTLRKICLKSCNFSQKFFLDTF